MNQNYNISYHIRLAVSNELIFNLPMDLNNEFNEHPNWLKADLVYLAIITLYAPNWCNRILFYLLG